MRHATLRLLRITALAVLLTACARAPAAPATPTKVPGGGEPVMLEIGTQGEALLFDKDTLMAPAGSTITLKFSSLAVSDVQMHNWVLAKPGTEDTVASNGISAGPVASYVQPNEPGVLAYTKLIKGGESTQVTFDAPPPGRYPYICTFPGHSAIMRGSLIIS